MTRAKFLKQALSSCTTIRQGQVGVKRTLGKYADKPYTEGLRVYNPFVSKIVKVSTQTENLEVALSIPSKEGLNIMSEVSILYKVLPDETPKILRHIGTSYEANVILPVFRSAVADVTSRFFASINSMLCLIIFFPNFDSWGSLKNKC